MKRIAIIAFSAMLFSCSKNDSSSPVNENSERVPQITYDTTVVDSFGPGATSESVMAKINAVAIKREKDSLAAIAKAQEEKLLKEKAEKEAKEKKEQKTIGESKPETSPAYSPENSSPN
jgi:competence protein ComGC